MIPPPPELKPTIIQMQTENDDGSAITDKQRQGSSPVIVTINGNTAADGEPKKKRRRSSNSLVSQHDIEKRRREHKTAHSIIEKKRRIRMNREFEALKFLVPACRNNLNTSNNNGEGMYKLTILQATVDYIRYLHQVINTQEDELKKCCTRWEDEDLDFAKVDVNTEEYRNLDNEFSFTQLLEEYVANKPTVNGHRMDRSNSATATMMTHDTRHLTLPSSRPRPQSERLRANSELLSTSFQTLPSPIITPELYPHSTVGAASASTSSSTSASSTTYKTQPQFKHDFHFPMNPTSTQPPVFKNGFDTLPVSALEGGSGSTTDKLESISEGAVSPADQHNTAERLLLEMKEGGQVTSIRSLLN